MLRVPPAPVPTRVAVSTMAPTTLGVLAHAEIIVGAPDHDVALALRRMPDRVREAARDPLEVGENTVAALVMQAV